MVGFDHENGANVYFLANSQKQSSILFNEAKRMIDASPWLKQRFQTTRSEIRFPLTNGTIVAMSAERRTRMEKTYPLACSMKSTNMKIMT